MPQVSVVMNCYNGERFLRAAIDSVFAQTYTDWEIVFLDNASTDTSIAIAGSYGEKVRIYPSDVNTSLGAARNRALAECRGTYIAFLDVDDIWYPDKLAKQMAVFEETDADFVYGGLHYIDEQGEIFLDYLPKNTPGVTLGAMLTYYDIPMVCAVFHRRMLTPLNGEYFSDTQKYGPEFELFMRMLAEGARFHPIRDHLAQYRIHTASLTKQVPETEIAEGFATIERLERDYPHLAEQYAAGFAHYRTFIRKKRAMVYIAKKDFRSAREDLKAAAVLGRKHRLRYWLSMLPFPSFWFQLYNRFDVRVSRL